MTTTKTRAHVGAVRGATTAPVLTILEMTDGRIVEVPGALPSDVEYDVEVTVTPRRWAPDGYEWEGDALRSRHAEFRVVDVGNTCGFDPSAKAIEGRLGGGRIGTPVEVLHAFEKAGLL